MHSKILRGFGWLFRALFGAALLLLLWRAAMEDRVLVDLLIPVYAVCGEACMAWAMRNEGLRAGSDAVTGRFATQFLRSMKPAALLGIGTACIAAFCVVMRSR